MLGEGLGGGNPGGRAGAAGAEVVARHVGEGVELTFTNKGSGTVQLKISDGYRDRTTTVKVRPGAVLKRTVDLAGSRRWYDLSVTSEADNDASFVRRFAGHVENGRPGVSDPATVT